MGDDCEIAPHRDTKIVNCQLSIQKSAPYGNLPFQYTTPRAGKQAGGFRG